MDADRANRRHDRAQVRPTRLVGVVLALAALFATRAAADTITLRRDAAVAKAQVRLADVAALEGADAEALADVQVAAAEVGSGVSVSHAAVREALNRRGVNWARMSLSGYETCRVRRLVDPPDAAPAARRDDNPTPSAASTVLANPPDEVDLQSQITVGEHLIDWLSKFAGVAPERLVVEPDAADAALLDAAAWNDRFVFRTSASAAFGRMPVTLERFRGEKLLETRRIGVRVAQRLLIAVARKDLRRGETLSKHDAEIREVTLDRDQGGLVTNLDDVLDKTLTASLRAGDVLSHDHVAAPVLVQRNELIRVQAVAGGIVVQMFGRALEDGVLDQYIRVRNDRSRETIVARVIGPRRAVLMNDATPVARQDSPVLTDDRATTAITERK